MAEPTEAFLEVTDPQGGTTRHRLHGSRMVLGRSPEVEITLAAQTVSRQHAEVFADPFGRWWIRDRGSRNGTRVNGQNVDEHLLRNGDRIEIEEFVLHYRATGPEPQRARGSTAGIGSVTISDAASPDVSRLDSLTPPRSTPVTCPTSPASPRSSWPPSRISSGSPPCAAC